MADALVVLYSAALVESLVNIIRTIRAKETDWRYWVSLAFSIGVSLLVTWNWEVDLFSLLLGVGRIPLIGSILTGFIVARGSNAVSDLFKLINAARLSLTNNVRNQQVRQVLKS